MGVQGLWSLLEPVGKIVPLEGMAGKVLAVDVSIWLHQAIKGMHDAHGAPVAVAHLLILFHRLCKLLFYQIKPVFVFDGGVPALKRETMAARRKVRSTAENKAMKVREKLFKNLMKHEAVRQMLSHVQGSELLGLSSLALPGSSIEEELFQLPPLTEKQDERSEDERSSEEADLKFDEDIHTIDVTSSDFKELPPEVRHEILMELIETRKQSSWKYIDSMPKESDTFSDFQMNRLLKRRAVQSSLDEVGKEMGGKAMSMKELESLLQDQPNVLETEDFLPSKRIAQSEHSRYLLIQKGEDDEKRVEETKSEIKTEPEDIPSTSKEVHLLDDISEVKEELTQQEIYDIIKKESETITPKESKLTKERKMKVTDDVREILPMLGVEGDQIGKIENFSEFISSGTRSIEKKDLLDIKDSPVEPEQVDSPSGKHSEQPVGDEQTEIVVELGCFVESTGKVEPEVIKDVKKPEAVESSEESDDDFVDVSDLGFPDNTLPVANTIMEVPEEQSMEIVIDAEGRNTDTDDIFSDVFSKKIEEVKELPGSGENVETVASVPSLGEKDLVEMKELAEEECKLLIQEQGKQERIAQNISDQMNLDAQELLRLFGVPYLVAPMEAEAQCAVLNILGLTDGTITDDSDIWLFGGKVVYKNFFNQKKHVLQYKSEDIQKCFRLSREDLIKIALLVGSDYTSGLEGVGPVTALEILGAFPSSENGGLLSGLRSFREWFSTGNDVGPIKRSLRRKIKNTKISPSFPSEAVVQAYLNPEVDESKEPFSWAKPNLVLLQQYTKRKFGWNQEKCLELVTPVMKRLNESKKDTTLDRYFKTFCKESSLEAALSKRVQTALKQLGNEMSAPVLPETDEGEPEKKKKKRSLKTDGHKTSGPGRSDLARGKPKVSDIPQKRAMEQVLEERKKSAIRIFREARKGTKKPRRTRVVKEEVNLSESSSDSS